MSCYKPLKGIVLGEIDGKRKIKVVPYDSIEDRDSFGRTYESFPLPCGHCVGCRQDQAKEWSNRLLMESLYHAQSYFVTLTYDDNHAHFVDYVNPRNGQFFPKDTKHQATLFKKDVQDFMKRLRQSYWSWRFEWFYDFDKLEWQIDSRTGKLHIPEDKIRFYAAGEYGGHTFRPHYHLILFGFEVPESKFIPCGKSETGDQYFILPELAELWPFGFHSIEPANEFTFKYCANYVTKKLGIHPNDYYLDQGLQPPFNLMSRKPGIGAQYLIDHPEIMDNDRIVIGTSSGSYDFCPPRYFKKSYKEVFPDRYESHVDLVSKASEDRIAAIEKKTGLDYTEYLRTPELVAEAKLNRRDKV